MDLDLFGAFESTLQKRSFDEASIKSNDVSAKRTVSVPISDISQVSDERNVPELTGNIFILKSCSLST